MQCLVEVVCEGREEKGKEGGGMERGKGGRTGEEKRKSLREEVGIHVLIVTIDHRVYSKLAGYALDSVDSIVLDFIVLKFGLFNFPNSLDHGGIVLQIVSNSLPPL